ncbi:UDP-N-acetylmuramoyl-L-alanyl-D-glutamate--2,6-diaminopimelate ligase [Pseudothauera rhizosphaerae]|uniref:UDP-N-acetylmuramoyl-L-alanyl-D-glutamate--2,6-diaminopimelate ligase n=1 Tax=Pseudothauera rhizosphaerae TaxID=2565932 RepID=A0A4S4APV6_9RHOO|nr:UDP-N-acetylmuramoyl-L-alanyl-D-glutamate--2,6-diaminopimelate ligase [Pseudothauera rhizosphaerae]THF61193.1 UDP-N-acetylmuramoyl-L-alanyl-D-glutamate--2,6-diaminopimelate ligase [Pseudothauera rhizosphaerae]
MSAPAALTILDTLRRAGVAPAGMTADSRRVVAGDVFAAWPGFRSDGRRYIGDAVARGAAAVLWDDADGFELDAVPVPALGVGGLRELAGSLADEIFGRPSAALWLAGVTGTNGKTTVSQWLARALSELGARCGVIGTLGCGFPGELVEGVNTTPDAIDLHRHLAEFRAVGAEAAAMEVSSIGLDQGRVNGARFDVGIYTNLSRDHLDYHGTMEAYAATKARFFDLPGVATAVINLDDTFGLTLARRQAERGMDVIGYTRVATNADAVRGARVLIADGLHHAPGGLRFALGWEGRQHDLQVRMVAPFNVSNLLAVAGALLARGAAVDDMAGVLARLTPPAGRMQLVGGVAEPLVVIDYAHSPDALAKVLEAVRDTASTRHGRVVCVFGCGGDRDPGKRPLMGEVASQLADRVIVTSDNPRSEDPMQIIAAVAAGARAGVDRVVDRAQAIALAIAEAAADDVVVVAGKGHEPYQEVLGQRLPFSDLDQARAALQAWNRKQGVGA